MTLTLVVGLILLAVFFAGCCWAYFTTPVRDEDPHRDVAKMESGKR